MVSNIFIDSIMCEIKGYKGTFSSNTAPKLKNDQSIILNFSKYREEGTHFIAIFVKNDKCFYFDPLCINYYFVPYEIKHYLKKYKKYINISKKIQNNSSDFCGFFCMLFIISFTISEKYFLNILSKFDRDKMKNDNICISLLRKTINKYFKNKKANMIFPENS